MLASPRDAGLSTLEAQRRLLDYGPNRLRTERHEPLWAIFLEELREPMVLLLLFTGVLYAVWGSLFDALTIFAVILLLNSVEVYNEQRAKRAITALRKLAEPTASVLRDGIVRELPVEEIVPGDIVQLRAGHLVPADARLVESYSLAINESLLTGEAVPVEKESSAELPAETALADRRNMAYAGTLVTRGRGTAVVIATGTHTEMGRIASLTREVRPPRTPLQRLMRELTRKMIWFALGFSLLVPLLGLLLSHQSLRTMVLTGLSLAFATIPEELPIIITMVLALGAYRLARHHVVVKRLQAVETLGAVTLIATDKTGTLTENQMQVQCCYPSNQREALLLAGASCSDLTSSDPLDIALLQAAREAGIDLAALLQRNTLLDEFTFDNTRKRMSVVYQVRPPHSKLAGDHKGSPLRDEVYALRIVARGAPESILACCCSLADQGTLAELDDERRRMLLTDAAAMASEGLRVLAIAEKTTTAGRVTQEQAESELALIGLVGLLDPPRPAARSAIATCHEAGIRTIMITGDHPATAIAIARQVGLYDENGGDNRKADLLVGTAIDALSDEALREAVGYAAIFARTTPGQKLRIVQALHARGEVVAVTGDGMNDAPALAAADIGIAMGERGSDAAREAADMVLTGDDFSAIERAVEVGRTLYANLRKGVRFYLSCKLALIAATLLPVLLGVPVPFAPIQIILMELFLDLAAAASYSAEPAEGDLMRSKPRDPAALFLDRAMLISIATSAASLFAAVTLVYLVTWYASRNPGEAQSAAFVTWLLGHVLLAQHLRTERQPLLRLGLFSNRLMLAWLAATCAFVALIMLVPWLHTALHIVTLDGGTWLLIFELYLVSTSWIEVRKSLHEEREKAEDHSEYR